MLKASFRLACACLLTTSLTGTALSQPAAPQAPARWSHFPARPQPPANAPNILLIMTDDVGFGASSGFGGLIDTPTFDALGAQGVRFNRFHTTSMCSPTRAALLTGRNHHAVDSGAIANLARDLPGYTSAIPDSAATIADVLRANGYVTAFLGKNHNTPEWESGAMGPFDRWPTGLGFDYFYGFNAAWADQFAPELVENTTQVEPPRDPDYILDKDLADHAIQWLHAREQAASNNPFFLYVATGSPHTPHQAPAAWIERYRGRFDMGWDEARRRIFARQKALGVIPANAVLTPRPAGLPAWASLGAEDKRVAARMMEIYAAQLSYADAQIGRIIEDLRRTGQLDNTLVIFIQGDNGADMASLNGEANEFGAFFGEEPSYHELAAKLDILGSARSFGGYPAGWAWATNTPFPWGKAMAGHLGGIRSAMVMTWPRGISRHGAVDSRFAHVVDIAPTIYAAAGIEPPAIFEGIAQQPLDGQSLAGEFTQQGPEPPRRQYFEMLGNLGFYEDGWFIGTRMQRPPWDRTSRPTPIPSSVSDFPWALYNLAEDYSQSRDLARSNPGKLRSMVADFAAEAEHNHVFPVQNDVMTLLRPGIRPEALSPRASYSFQREYSRYLAADIPGLRGRWRMTADIDTHSASDSGPVFVQGGRFSGWGLLLRNGRPRLVSRPSFDTAKFTDITASVPLQPGRHALTIDIVPDPAAGPNAARATISVDGHVAAEGPVPHSGILANPAYLGRFGLTPLVDEADVPDRCGCTVHEVTLWPHVSAETQPAPERR